MYDQKILVADDHSIVRTGLIMLIKNSWQEVSVTEASNYATVQNLVEKEKFNLIILDVNMPNGTFISTMNFIKKTQPNAKILVFSALDEQLHAKRYIDAGADGFLNKLANETQVKTALEKMFTSGKYLSDDVKDNLIFSPRKLEENPLKLLSTREMDIAIRLMKGKRIKEISHELNLQVTTVSTYKVRIFEKLSIQSVPELLDIFKFYEGVQF